MRASSQYKLWNSTQKPLQRLSQTYAVVVLSASLNPHSTQLTYTRCIKSLKVTKPEQLHLLFPPSKLFLCFPSHHTSFLSTHSLDYPQSLQLIFEVCLAKSDCCCARDVCSFQLSNQVIHRQRMSLLVLRKCCYSGPVEELDERYTSRIV